MCKALFKMDVPDTYNEPLKEVLLFNVVVPDTFNELFIVVMLFSLF